MVTSCLPCAHGLIGTCGSSQWSKTCISLEGCSPSSIALLGMSLFHHFENVRACYHWIESYRQFPRYWDNHGDEVCEVPILMVVLVAMVVSKTIYFITVLINHIVVCCHLWVVQWVPSVDGIFCKHLPRCVSRPHWHIEPCPGPAQLCIPCHDAWHLR
jgi:hypothetical protein